jgi:hypothetical protein
MISRRRLGTAVAAALAASVMFAGASALAASGLTRGNYHGPARPAHAVTITHRANYRGPARVSARAATERDPNRPASNARQ